VNDPNAADAILDRLKALGDLADSAAQPATALYCRSLALWLEGGRHIADDDLSRRLQALAARIDELPWKGQRSDTGWQLVRAGVQAVLARLHDILPALFQTAAGMEKLDRWIATPVTRIRELHGLIDAIESFCVSDQRGGVSRAYRVLWQLRGLVFGGCSDHARIESLVDELQRICDSRPGVAESDEEMRTLRHLVVRAMVVQAYPLATESSIARVESLAQRVEQIAGALAYAADRDMQHKRAEAWRFLAVAHANHGEPDATQAAAQRVEQIAGALAYAADRDMQRERAQAWWCLALAHANHGELDATRAAAQRVEQIAGALAYAADRGMQRERIRAWCCLATAHANHGELDATRAAVERLEQIAEAPAYAADRDMQHQRAQAWRALALAHANHGELDATRAAAQRVEQIAGALAYAVDRDMQRERARAWRILAFAHSRAGQYPAMQSAADMVEAICCADSLTVSGNAWNPARDELIALYNDLLKNLTGNAAIRRQLVERFRTIAQRFPDDAEIRRFWAQLQVVASPDTASVRPVSFGVSAWAQGAATSAYSVSFTGYRPPGSDKNSPDREDAIDSRPDGDREG
jgi:soluble cytochrome b562